MAVLMGTASAAVAVQIGLVVDHFDSGLNTLFIPNTQVANDVASTTVTATDTGLPDVLGGSRKLSVTATFIGGFGEQVVAGVEPPASFFEYNATVSADGNISLLYDRDGAGLNVGIGPYGGFRLIVTGADAAAVPYTMTLTLTDTDSVQGAVTKTVTAPGATEIVFLLGEFPNVNLGSIFSIQLDLDPSIAADVRFDSLEFLNRPVPSPAASPSTLAMAVLALIGVAGVALRLRRA